MWKVKFEIQPWIFLISFSLLISYSAAILFDQVWAVRNASGLQKNMKKSSYRSQMFRDNLSVPIVIWQKLCVHLSQKFNFNLSPDISFWTNTKRKSTWFGLEKKTIIYPQNLFPSGMKFMFCCNVYSLRTITQLVESSDYRWASVLGRYNIIREGFKRHPFSSLLLLGGRGGNSEKN